MLVRFTFSFYTTAESLVQRGTLLTRLSTNTALNRCLNVEIAWFYSRLTCVAYFRDWNASRRVAAVGEGAVWGGKEQ